MLSESSIGAGVRRVEALVGVDAYRFLAREHVLLNSLTSLIKGSRTEELPERIADLLSKFKEIEKELAQVRSTAAMADISKFAAGGKEIDGATVISVRIPDGIAVDDLRKIALELRNRAVDSVVALVSVVDSKPVLVVAASDAARARGVKAGALVKIGSTVLGGGGGGKDDFAQGGGTNVGAIDQALQAIELAISGK